MDIQFSQAEILLSKKIITRYMEYQRKICNGFLKRDFGKP